VLLLLVTIVAMLSSASLIFLQQYNINKEKLIEYALVNGSSIAGSPVKRRECKHIIRDRTVCSVT